MGDAVRFDTTRFGAIEAKADEIVWFEGIPGFPEARRFVFRDHDRGSGFGWMVCADDPRLTFVVADSTLLVPDYEPVLPPRALRALGVDSVDALVLLVIASLSEEGSWLNLGAPIAVNPRTRRGMQVILESGGFALRVPMEPSLRAQEPLGLRDSETRIRALRADV